MPDVEARLSPERRDRAEVVIGGDDRHPDREPGAVRRCDDTEQLPLRGRRRRRLGGQEDLPGDEIVAGRIPIGARERSKRGDGQSDRENRKNTPTSDPFP